MNNSLFKLVNFTHHLYFPEHCYLTLSDMQILMNEVLLYDQLIQPARACELENLEFPIPHYIKTNDPKVLKPFAAIYTAITKKQGWAEYQKRKAPAAPVLNRGKAPEPSPVIRLSESKLNELYETSLSKKQGLSLKEFVQATYSDQGWVREKIDGVWYLTHYPEQAHLSEPTHRKIRQ